MQYREMYVLLCDEDGKKQQTHFNDDAITKKEQTKKQQQISISIPRYIVGTFLSFALFLFRLS